MSRLVEIDLPPPAEIKVRPGDLLRFGATGGRIESGEDVIEALGGFAPGVAAESGEVIVPETAPTAFMLRALAPGRARVSLFAPSFGFDAPERSEVVVVVGD